MMVARIGNGLFARVGTGKRKRRFVQELLERDGVKGSVNGRGEWVPATPKQEVTPCNS